METIDSAVTLLTCILVRSPGSGDEEWGLASYTRCSAFPSEVSVTLQGLDA